MRGTVTMINHARGFAAIELKDHGHTVVELLGDELELGDEVDGALDALGDQTLTRVSTRSRIAVIVQDYWLSAEAAREVLQQP